MNLGYMCWFGPRIKTCLLRGQKIVKIIIIICIFNSLLLTVVLLSTRVCVNPLTSRIGPVKKGLRYDKSLSPARVDLEAQKNGSQLDRKELSPQPKGIRYDRTHKIDLNTVVTSYQNSYVADIDLLRHYETFICKRKYSPGNLVPKVNVSISVDSFPPSTRRAVLYRTRFANEQKHATRGGPLRPLPEYKNPCWEAHLPENMTALYQTNLYYSKWSSKQRLDTIKSKLHSLLQIGAKHQIRCLPYFFILGVTKCGTTDLYALLLGHPEVVAPLTKEPMYWNKVRVSLYEKPVYFKDYVDMFDSIGVELLTAEMHMASKNTSHIRKKITVDSSPSYLWDFFGWEIIQGNIAANVSNGPAFIAAHTLYAINHNFKMVVMLRNPTDRVYSQYVMWRRGKSPDDFHRDVIDALKIFVACFRDRPMRACAYSHSAGKTVGRHIAASIYYIYIRDWCEIFPIEQFFFVKSEEYFANRRSIVPSLLSFLQMGNGGKTFDKWTHNMEPQNTKTRFKDRNLKPMRKDTRDMLDRFYSPFNEMLSTYLKNDKWLWRIKGADSGN